MKEKGFETLDDEQLVRLIKKQNQLAFSELFDRYWATMLDAALKVVKDEAIAEDVVQEVFTDLWKKSTLRDITNIRSYLQRSVKYKSIDQIRKARISFIDLDFVDHYLSSNNNIEDQIYLKDLSCRLNESTDSLPTQCKRIFKMSRFEELSNKEIADRLNISVRTVENHISHALKILRPAIGAEFLFLCIILFSF